jgi:hypothetical protein
VDAVSEAVQGGEDVKLIDADALPIVTRGKNHHRKYVYADITDAPTIDAIPVEWLESKRKEALHEGMRPDEVETVEMVLWMWQKEQEAQDE